MSRWNTVFVEVPATTFNLGKDRQRPSAPRAPLTLKEI